uniref:T-cell receptor alpha/delta variable 15.0 n=1 Tax=Oncorhynchus kisutch TaxID=8019 RepID=A0A8C7HQ99_ONCKI
IITACSSYKLFNLLYSIFLTELIAGDEITSLNHEVIKSEGESVTLSCSYDTSQDKPWLFWYRHYPNQTPQFLLYKDITPGFTLNHNKNAKRTDLKISSAEVTDSAMYYCALSSGSNRLRGSGELLC